MLPLLSDSVGICVYSVMLCRMSGATNYRYIHITYNSYDILLGSTEFVTELCTDPGKSWDLKFKFSRPGKSWKINQMVVTF